MVIPQQGEVWWAEARDRRRPVVVVTRTDAVPALTTIIVAPVTRTVRRIPTELPLDESDGLREPCVASFDSLQPVRRTALTGRVASATPSRRAAICRALSALADCGAPARNG